MSPSTKISRLSSSRKNLKRKSRPSETRCTRGWLSWWRNSKRDRINTRNPLLILKRPSLISTTDTHSKLCKSTLKARDSSTWSSTRMIWSSYLTQRSMIALILNKRLANANRISKIHSNTSRILNNKNRSTRGSLKNSISFLPMKTNKLMNQSLLFRRSISTLSIKLRNSDKKSKRLRQKCNWSPPLNRKLEKCHPKRISFPHRLC